MSIVTTAASVFTTIDPERPCGEIVRIGGGKYRLDKFDGSGSIEADDLAAATTAAGQYVAALEADPKADQGTLTIRKLQAALDDANARVADLEKQLDAKTVGGVVGTVDQTLGDAKAG